MVIVWALCLGSTCLVTLSLFSRDNVSTIKCKLCLMCGYFFTCTLHESVRMCGDSGRTATPRTASLPSVSCGGGGQQKLAPHLSAPPPHCIVMWARLLRSHVTPIVPVQRPFTVFRCDREEFVRALPFTKCSTAIFPDTLQFSFALLRWYHLSLFDHVICKSLIR